MEKEPSGRKPRADAERNRQRLIEAAKASFARDGGSASLEEIARSAGVGIGTPAPRKLTASQQAVMGYLSGQDQGVRRAQVVKALEPQGVSKSRAYAALTELQIAGLVVEVQGLVYMPKGAAE